LKHYSAVMIAADSRSDLPQKDATAVQKAATWTPFYADTGAYDVRGTAITVHRIVAKDPGEMAPGNIGTADFKIVGNTLAFTATDS
jgi:hypothetical protein